MLEFLKIVAFSMAAAIAFGIAHDMVTAHICVEYFTIAHPPVFSTQSPLLLALGWGVIATWWVGLGLGLLLALAARLGAAPPQKLRDVRPRVVALMLVSGLASALSGTITAILFARGAVGMPGDWGSVIDPDNHLAFAAVASAHLASYTMGALGGLVVIGVTIARRLAARGTIARGAG